jgi:hypothetical protein
MARREGGPGRAFLSALLLAAFGSFGGCGEKDSLIVVTASTAYDSYATNLHTLVVTAGGTTQSFHIPTDITLETVKVGLYVPSSVTGRNITVKAEAVGSATACGPGYSGTTTVSISAGGATVQADILMHDATTCPPNQGTGGTTGRGGSGGGTGGTGGVGGPPPCTANAQPPAGTPPQLTCCAEYDQDTPEACGTSGTEIDATVFSPDGTLLVTAAAVSSGGTLTGNDVKVWSFNGHTLAPLEVLPSDGWLSVAFSPDGTKLAVAVNGGIDVWNTHDWSYDTLLVGSSNFFGGVGFTPDSRLVVAVDRMSTTSGNLYLFDLTSASAEVPIVVKALTEEPDSVGVAPKAANGQLGVAIAYNDGNMDVFSLSGTNFSGPTHLVVDTLSSPIWNPVFSADGSLLAISDASSTIHFWSFPVPASLAESGAPITFSTSDASDIAFGLGFSPNGNFLAAGGGDSLDYTVDPRLSLFSVSSRSAVATTTLLSYSPTSVAFSPIGNAIAGGEIDCGRVFVCTN